MTHTCTGYALTACWGDVYQQQKVCKSLKNAMQRRTEAITKYSAHKPKSSSVDSSGQRCMKTPKNSSKGVGNVSCKVAALLETQCPFTTTCKWRSLMYGALTSWGQSKSPITESTSLSPLIMYQSGWKHYHAELLMPDTQGRCSMKWSSLALEHREWW